MANASEDQRRALQPSYNICYTDHYYISQLFKVFCSLLLFTDKRLASCLHIPGRKNAKDLIVDFSSENQYFDRVLYEQGRDN